MKIENRYIRIGRRRVRVVTAAEAGTLTGCTAKAFRTYSAERRPTHNPAPEAVGRDMDTGAKLYPYDEVIAWQGARLGRGKWTPAPLDPDAVLRTGADRPADRLGDGLGPG